MDDLNQNARTRDPDQKGPVGQVAGETAGAAASAGREVASTAKDQARNVAGEVRSQARTVASDVKQRVGDQARSQNDRLAGGLRRMADELEEMVGDRGDSPARSVVSQVANGGRRAADYLAERGPEGVLSEVQDFARRRPGAFLATALVAGFVVGRLGKNVLNADQPSSTAGSTGTGYSGTGYTGSEYTGSDLAAGGATAAGFAGGAAGQSYADYGTTTSPLETTPSSGYAAPAYPDVTPPSTYPATGLGTEYADVTPPTGQGTTYASSAALDPDAPASPYPPEPQVVDAPDYRYGDTSSEGRPR